jgi:hypothetical protein
MTPFDILMILALGSFFGTAIGLAIGFLARQQKPVWGLMTRKEKIINIALVLFFSGACIAGLTVYELL